MANHLSERLADLARTLQDAHDVTDTADHITREVVAWAGEDAAAGISIVRRRRSLESLATTSDIVVKGDALQYELGEGPCVDAAWEERQVYSPDLASEARWPTWGQRAADDLGTRSMLCTQLFTIQDQLGALNVYSPRVDAFDEQIRDELIAFASHAAIAVADAQEIQGLQTALDRRTTIGAAVGIIMERFDTEYAPAFNLLKRLSQEQNRKLFDIAEQVVNTRRLPT